MAALINHPPLPLAGISLGPGKQGQAAMLSGEAQKDAATPEEKKPGVAAAVRGGAEGGQRSETGCPERP